MNPQLVIGLGFGDEAKGSHVDFLTRRAAGPVTVVRFNGGAQCGHGVTTVDGQTHVFRQFGAGTFAGALTYLSRHVLVNPITLQREAEALSKHGLKDPLGLISLDREALVTNVYHVAANRLAETLRGDNRHGSCGMGIGETVADSIAHPEMALNVGDLLDRTTLRKKLQFTRELKLSHFAGRGLSGHDPNWSALSNHDVELQVERYFLLGKMLVMVDRDRLKTLLEQGMDLIFEGAQGVLLDQDYGFHPHTTWSKTTFENALALLDEAGFDSAQATRIGITRAYATRHGDGPMPTEQPDGQYLGDWNNKTNDFQGNFRTGHFDAVLARYAQRVVGRLDELVITNLDKVKADRPKMCMFYRMPPGVLFRDLPVQPGRTSNLKFQEQLTRDLSQAEAIYRELESPGELVHAIHGVMETPISWCSTGPTAADKVPGPNYPRE
jgi:adenylosuccinate synthase